MEDQRLKSGVLNIKTGSVFPWHFKLIAVVIIVGAVGIFTTNILLSLVFFMIGIIILTAYSGVLINPSNKTYRVYNSFIYLKSGKVLSYKGIEKIFVNANKESQKIYTAHTLDSNTFKNTVYDGYLKFTDGENVHLISRKDKPVVMDTLKTYADFLKVTLQDNTVHA